MITLNDGMLLYHGSYTSVNTIDLTKCRPGKDFGKGFYLTSDYGQARSFIPMSVRKMRLEGYLLSEHNFGYISVFQVQSVANLHAFIFQDATRDWLHFVAFNRKSNLFPELSDKYSHFEIIGGKIANDRTARTLQLYVSGAFGEPGSPEADSFAIHQLLPNRLGDQFCYRTETAIRQLTFVRSDRIEFSS